MVPQDPTQAAPHTSNMLDPATCCDVVASAGCWKHAHNRHLLWPFAAQVTCSMEFQFIHLMFVGSSSPWQQLHI